MSNPEIQQPDHLNRLEPGEVVRFRIEDSEVLAADEDTLLSFDRVAKSVQSGEDTSGHLRSHDVETAEQEIANDSANG